jgi:hypothetical protein
MAISTTNPPLSVKYLEYYKSSGTLNILTKERLGMSQQQKLEQVLDLLLSEDSEQAAEILHQIIVEKARVIYESIVDEEEVSDEEKDELDESDEVGGEPNKDFTDEIKTDKSEVDSDEHNAGEAGEEDEFSDEESEECSTDERIEDLESQLAELRAEFDALMGEELQEPQHADLEGMDPTADVEPAMDEDMDEMDEMDDMGSMGSMGGEEKVVGEVVATMFEKKAKEKLEKAKQAKKGEMSNKKKMDEETKFLNKVADTGQRGTAKLVGTGKNTPLGAEQNKSSFTNIPARKDYGGKPTKIGGNGGTGGEYGKYNGESAKDDTPTDNVNVEPKKSSIKADTTAKFTGGKSAGTGFTKSPLTKKPA